MKTRTFIAVSILFMVAFVLIGGSSKKEITIDEVMEALCYTWINPDYNTNPGIEAIIVFHPNGKVELYSETTAISSTYGEFVITNKWADSKGNIWFSYYEERPLTNDWYYILNKISNSGKTLEQAWAMRDYPTEIDTEHVRYAIYTRQ